MSTPYCTVDDYRSAYPGRELDDFLSRGGAGADLAVFDKALARATSEINMYIGGRYPLPLAAVPELVKGFAIDLTRYYLHGDLDSAHPALRRRNEVVSALVAISRGNGTLGIDANDSAPAGSNLVQVAPGRNDFGDRSKW